MPAAIRDRAASGILSKSVSASHSRIENRLIELGQVAGVFATAWFVLSRSVLPRLGQQSLARLIGEALLYVTLAWVCAAAITLCIYLVVSLADLKLLIRASVRSSVSAMWFAPAIVLLSAGSAAAVAASILLVVSATRILVSQWIPMGAEIRPAPAGLRLDLMFYSAELEQASFSLNSIPVLAVSFAIQAGMVAALWHYWLLAAALFAAGTAILTSLSIVTGAYQPEKVPTLPLSMFSVVLTFLLAAALSVGGVRALREKAASSEPDPKYPAKQSAPRVTRLIIKVAAPANATVEIGGGSFPGVVLLTEVKPEVTLILPPSPHTGVFGSMLAGPVGIPFSGEYWMFKPPLARPPANSFVRRGSPSELSFITTDGAPMEMAARQNMGYAIDVKCCSKIQLVISDADRYPGTVSLELILINTEASETQFESLGTSLVNPYASHGDIVSFPIPSFTKLQRFDEVEVLFHRDRFRADKSARISIERLTLVP